MEDTIDPRWRKSTRSSGNGGACVEVGDGDGAVLVRDTANRGGETLGFSTGTWAEFTSALK